MPQEFGLSEIEIGSIYDALENMSVTLDDLPTPAGIRQQVAQARSFLTEAVNFQMKIRKIMRVLSDMQRRKQVELDIKVREMLASDEVTRQQASVTDRKAYAVNSHKSLANEILELELKVDDYKAVEEIVKLRVGDLRGIISDLNLQYKSLRTDEGHIPGEGGVGETREEPDADMPGYDDDDVEDALEESVDAVEGDPTDLVAEFTDREASAEESLTDFEDLLDSSSVAESTQLDSAEDTDSLLDTVEKVPQVVTEPETDSDSKELDDLFDAPADSVPEVIGAVPTEWDDLIDEYHNRSPVSTPLTVVSGTKTPDDLLDDIVVDGQRMKAVPLQEEIDIDDILGSEEK